MSTIPIKNIYYMLCYAWDILEESNQIEIDSSNFKNDLNFLAKIFLKGVNYQLKRGLYKGYITKNESIQGVKGKLDVSKSVKTGKLFICKPICDFDEFSENILQNQIIKTCFYKILKSKNLDKAIRNEIHETLTYFGNIELLEMNYSPPSKIIVSRNYKFYKYLLTLCEFIMTNLSPDEYGDNFEFSDFTRDPHKMRKLYEKFILNFFKKEARDFYDVNARIYDWVGLDANNPSSKLVPKLKTDIEIKSKNKDKKIIIDSKFEPEALKMHWLSEKEKINSKYLMQLMSYLENYKRIHGITPKGILLYPCVGNSFSITNKIWDFEVQITTLNLSRDWEEIEAELLQLVA